MNTLKSTRHSPSHPILSQSWAIVLAVGFVSILDFFSLDIYFLQLTGIFALFYLARNRLPLQVQSHTEAFILTASILMIILTTGSLASPLFFIVLLGLFAVSFRTSPWSSLIYSMAIVYFFMARTLIWQPGSDPASLISLLSLPLMTPFAFLFGREYQVIKEQNKRLRQLLFDQKRLRQTSIATKENTLIIVSTSLQQSVQAIKEAVQEIDFSVQNTVANLKPWTNIKRQLQQIESLRKQLKTYLED